MRKKSKTTCKNCWDKNIADKNRNAGNAKNKNKTGAGKIKIIENEKPKKQQKIEKYSLILYQKRC